MITVKMTMECDGCHEVFVDVTLHHDQGIIDEINPIRNLLESMKEGKKPRLYGEWLLCDKCAHLMKDSTVFDTLKERIQ